MLTVFLCFHENFSLSRCTASLALALRHNSNREHNTKTHAISKTASGCMFHSRKINYNMKLFFFIADLAHSPPFWLCSAARLNIVYSVLSWLSSKNFSRQRDKRQAPIVSLKINYIFSASLHYAAQACSSWR